MIIPFVGDSAYVSDADSLCEIGADHGYHSDPSLVLTFEMPFSAIGDALYGRLMKDVPFSPPRGFSLPLPALTTARGYRQREVP